MMRRRTANTVPFRATPSITMSRIYGPGLVNNPRPPFSRSRWLPSESTVWDGRTGSVLSFLGGMPALCAGGLLTRPATRLFALAGIEPPADTLVYHDRDEYESHIRAVRRRGLRMVFHHVHPPTERPASDYWIDPGLLSALNDKASLAALVPGECLPRRRLVSASEARRIVEVEDRWPVIVKGTGPASSGGGYSVGIAAHAGEVQTALAKFAPAETVVVEEFVEIHRNFCLNYATVDGDSVFLGGSEQVTDAGGGFHGNWLGLDAEPPPEMIAVGHEILGRALDRGYRGLAGFDMVLDAAGRIRVLDLNFRINFSTSAVVWMPTLRERHGSAVRGRHVRMEIREPLSRWCDRAAGLIREGSFFPVAVFDPDPVRQPGQVAALHGVWLGRTRDEIERKRQWFLQAIHPAARAA